MEEIFEIFTISDDVYEIWRNLPQLITLTMIVLIIAKNLLAIVSLKVDVAFVVWLVCCLHSFTTVFVDTRLWKTKHPRKRFQNFRQCFVLLTDRTEIHQSQPHVRPSNLLYGMLSGCDWWISIRSVNNTRKTDGNFGNVSAGVLFSKVAYQRKRW